MNSWPAARRYRVARLPASDILRHGQGCRHMSCPGDWMGVQARREVLREIRDGGGKCATEIRDQLASRVFRA